MNNTEELKNRESVDITLVHERIFSDEGKAIITTCMKHRKKTDVGTTQVNKLLKEMEGVIDGYRMIDIILASYLMLADTLRCSIDFEKINKHKSESKTDNYIM